MQRRFLVLLLLLPLAACVPAPKGEVTPATLMGDKGAPEVGTMEAALLKSAEASVRQNHYARAAQLYEQLAQRVPGNSLYVLARADALRRSGQFAKARQLYDDFLRDNPDSLVAHEGRGLTLLAQGEVELAIAALDAVAKRDAKRWRASNGLGIAYSMQQKFDEAIAQYRAALDASDSNPSVLNNLGLALAIKEDYPRAIKSLELARSRTEQMPEQDAKRIGLNLAMVYGLSGDMAKAESTARPYVTEPELYNNLGHYAVMAKNKELARTYLNMALTNSKEHYERAWENLKELQ